MSAPLVDDMALPVREWPEPVPAEVSEAREVSPAIELTPRLEAYPRPGFITEHVVVWTPEDVAFLVLLAVLALALGLYAGKCRRQMKTSARQVEQLGRHVQREKRRAQQAEAHERRHVLAKAGFPALNHFEEVSR